MLWKWLGRHRQELNVGNSDYVRFFSFLSCYTFLIIIIIIMENPVYKRIGDVICDSIWTKSYLISKTISIVCDRISRCNLRCSSFVPLYPDRSSYSVNYYDRTCIVRWFIKGISYSIINLTSCITYILYIVFIIIFIIIFINICMMKISLPTTHLLLA